jgi:hypothetical protein
VIEASDLEDKSNAEIYSAVGFAVCAWQKVEAGLFNVFREASRSTKLPLSTAIFYSIEHVKGQLDLTDRVIYTTLFDRSLIDKWDELSRKCISLNSRRNEIVHGTLVIAEGKDRKTFPCLQKGFSDMLTEAFRIMLKPMKLKATDPVARKAEIRREDEARRQRMLKYTDQRLTSEEILDAGRQFHALGAELSHFSKAVRSMFSATGK